MAIIASRLISMVNGSEVCGGEVERSVAVRVWRWGHLLCRRRLGPDSSGGGFVGFASPFNLRNSYAKF